MSWLVCFLMNLRCVFYKTYAGSCNRSRVKKEERYVLQEKIAIVGFVKSIINLLFWSVYADIK